MPGSCGEEARHKKSPFLTCFRPERPKKGDFLCRALAGKKPGTKSHLFGGVSGRKGPKKVTFCAGLLWGCRALAGKPLRAQGSGLRAQGSGLRGRGPAQKVTFFEVFQAGKAQKR